MIVLLFNIFTLLVSAITLYNFKLGYFIIFCAKFAIPSSVRFEVGGISINIFDVLLIALFLSFIIHKRKLYFNYPRYLKITIVIYVVTTFLFILLSSQVVPLPFQFKSFLKSYLFQELMFVIFGLYAFNGCNVKLYSYILLTIMILCGCYGLYTYSIGMNPYVDGLSLIYADDFSSATLFMDEERGGLEGRVFGTLTHPLEWGQVWCMVLAFFMIVRKKINPIFGIVVFSIGLINIYFSGSRTALMSMIVFFVFYAITLNVRKIFIGGVALSLMFVLFLLFGSNNKTIKNNIIYIESVLFFWDSSVTDQVKVNGSDTEMRQKQLELSIDMMMTNPIGGLGYNYQMYKKERDIEDGLLGMESIVFKKLVEQGLLSLFVFFFYYYAFYKYIKRRSNSQILTTGYFMSYFIGILITGCQGISWTVFLLLPFIFINDYQKKLLIKQRV